MQTDETLLANNYQNCWMLHLHTVLHVVRSCCTKFETSQTFSYVQTDATTPKNVESCWPTMLHQYLHRGNFTWKVAWPWQILLAVFSFSLFLCFSFFFGRGGGGRGGNLYFCVLNLMDTFTLKLILTIESLMPCWVYISSLYVSLFVILERKKEPKEISSCEIPRLKS